MQSISMSDNVKDLSPRERTLLATRFFKLLCKKTPMLRELVNLLHLPQIVFGQSMT